MDGRLKTIDFLIKSNGSALRWLAAFIYEVGDGDDDFYIAVTTITEKQPKRGKSCFGSQFQWIRYTWARQGSESMQLSLFTAWHQRRKKGGPDQGLFLIMQDPPVVTYFPQLFPPS